MCPTFEVPVRGRVDAEVVVQFLENVDERGGRLDSHRYREAKSVSLAWVVVGVLADDDRLDFIDRAKVEGRKNLGSRRVNHVVFCLFLQKFFFNLFKVWLLELVCEQVEPGFFEFDGHNEVDSRK